MKKWIKCNFTIKWSGYYVKYLWDETSYWQAIWKGKTIDSIDWIYIFINFTVDTKKLDSKNNLTLGRMLTDVFHTCYQVIVFHLKDFSVLLHSTKNTMVCDRLAKDANSSNTSDLTSVFFSEVRVCPAPVFFLLRTCDLKHFFVCSTCHAKKC